MVGNSAPRRRLDLFNQTQTRCTCHDRLHQVLSARLEKLRKTSGGGTSVANAAARELGEEVCVCGLVTRASYINNMRAGDYVRGLHFIGGYL